MADHFDRLAEVHERSERAISHSEALEQDDERVRDPYDQDGDEQANQAARERRDDAARHERAMERSADVAKDIFRMGVDAMRTQRGY